MPQTGTFPNMSCGIASPLFTWLGLGGLIAVLGLTMITLLRKEIGEGLTLDAAG